MIFSQAMRKYTEVKKLLAVFWTSVCFHRAQPDSERLCLERARRKKPCNQRGKLLAGFWASVCFHRAQPDSERLCLER
ncbi:MAG: hypothetical protein Q4D94_11795, partial [Bacillota bacterium]|nr:hypothetical protein [Bacillota bacterium]